MTPFEQSLSATPLREPPAALRTRILAAARAAERRPFSWRDLLPPRWALAALAAAWLAILAVNLTGPRGEALYVVTPPEFRDHQPSEQEYLARMDAEHRLLIALSADPVFLPRQGLRPAYTIAPRGL